jgi:hypothetical protein
LSRLDLQAVKWRKHIVEAVNSDPSYGCYSRVEQQEQDDGIVVHRSSIRYWTLKAEDPDFHGGTIGGARHTCFQDYELDIVKDYVIYFFSRDNFATQVDLADALSEVFQREVTVRVCFFFFLP